MIRIHWLPRWGIAMAGALCLAAGPASGEGTTGGASAQKDMTAQQRTTQTPATGTAANMPQNRADGVALIVVPIAAATADTMNNGCWARFYSERDYRGEVLALSGPVSLPNMGRVQPFWGEADSVVIGPKARVTTYDNDNYRDQTAVLASNQRVNDLRDRLRWNEGIDSVRVDCM